MTEISTIPTTQTPQQLLDDYKIGARKLLEELHDWTMNSSDAKQREQHYRHMWIDEATELGLSKSIATAMWEEQIIDGILSDDPAFM